MRILLIESNLRENGAIRVSLDRAERWARLGATIDLLVVSATAGQAAAIPARVAADAAKPPARPLPLAAATAFGRAVRRARRADVVVAGREIGPGIVIAAAAARAARRPFAVTVQNNIHEALANNVPGALRGANRWALRRADLAVCVSTGLGQGLLELGLASSAVRTVLNGVDQGELARSAAEPPAWVPPPGPYLISTGRLTRQKGFDQLIRAHAAALAAGAPRHTLVILGEGGDRAALEGLASALGVSGSVVLPGFVANPHPLVKASAAFVLSSRWEGFSLSLAEAFCVGVPMIATDCVAGPREILEDGRYGALVPVDDAGALARAIGDHLAQPERLHARLRQGQAEQATGRFQPDALARDHLDLLRGLVGSARA